MYSLFLTLRVLYFASNFIDHASKCLCYFLSNIVIEVTCRKTCMHMNMRICVCMFIYYISVNVCIHICVSMCMRAFVCECKFVYLYVCEMSAKTRFCYYLMLMAQYGKIISLFGCSLCDSNKAIV